MKLQGKRVLLTGAAGGIGVLVAKELAERGAAIALVDRNAEALAATAEKVAKRGGESIAISADLLDTATLKDVVLQTNRALGGIDLLINVAGLLSFNPFVEEDPGTLERILRLNLMAPMLLSREVLPYLQDCEAGRIVNVGSTFGAIGFAWFTAYSASKFGLRGFSEALRRELAGTSVDVLYIAPRAVRTKLNTGAIYRMAEAVGMNMDDPAWVAEKIVRAIESDAKEVHLGFPEKLFARINAFLPRLVDAALHKQNRVMEAFARES